MTRSASIPRLVLFIMTLAGSSVSVAQDGHYWTEQFGTRSMLLSGTVIGSVSDLGAVYYNPARIAQFESPAFAIAGHVYQYSVFRVENGLGQGLDSETSNFGGGPALVSGTFNLPFFPNSKFAYAFLTRTQYNGSLGFSFDDLGDYVDAFPGNELFSGEVTLNKTVNDEWMGGSWAHSLSDQLSVGVSGFYSVNEESTSAILRLQAFSATNETGMYYNRRGYGFRTNSLIGKVGVGWTGELATFGLTVTTPKLVARGEGRTSYETFLAGIDTTSGGDGIDDDIYIIDNQEGLDAKEKTPWSIGFGTGIKLGKSTLHLSAEWFDAVPEYTVLESAPFIAQSSGDTVQLSVKERLNSVFNYGFGFEYYVSESVQFFGSIATDFSAVGDDITPFSEFDEVTSNSTYVADVMHFGFGTAITTKFADITVGATYAKSDYSVKRNISVNPGAGDPSGDGRIVNSRWRFLVGFSFPFAEDLKDKVLDD